MVDLLNNLNGIYNNYDGRTKEFSPQIETRDQLFINKPTSSEHKKSLPMNAVTGDSPTESSSFTKMYPERKKLPSKPPPKLFRGGYRNNFAYSQHRENFSSLDQLKTMPMVLPDVVKCRRSNRSICTKCSPMTRKSLLEQVETLGLQNILCVNTQNSNNGYFTRKFYYLAYIFKTKASFKYPDVFKDVMNSERVNKAIKDATQQEIDDQSAGTTKYNKLFEKHRKRAMYLLVNMSSSISTFLIRLTAYVLFKVLSKLLKSIQVPKSQLEVIKNINKNSLPVIYLPLHRSHLDYILITFILYNYELHAPIVAAGDNLRIPLFGPLLRGLGAFFIKRKLDPKTGKKDFVYRAVLHTYMEQCLTKGYNLEFFIEGGRSRSGKACLPKAGLLSVVVDAFNDGSLEDVYFVPIGISYEKLLDNGFLAEQLGKPKSMESFTSAIKGIWNVLNSNYGSVRVDFATPFSLKEFVAAAEKFPNISPRSLLNGPPSPHATIRRIPSSASLYGTDIVIEDQRLLIKSLAEHILHDAVYSTALMSSNLVAFLLLNKHRQGVLLKTLVQDFSWICHEVLERRREVGFSGNPLDIVNHALCLLGDKLVSVQKSEEHPDLAFVIPNLNSPSVLELAYYSNVVVSVFLGDAVVATALLKNFGELQLLHGCDTELVVSKKILMDNTLDLCYILQYEFILTPPCITLETSAEEIFDEFLQEEILYIDDINGTNSFPKRRYLEDVDDEDDEEEELDFYNDIHYRVNLSKTSVQKLSFYGNVLAPFIEGYWYLGSCLKYLVQNEMEERKFICLVQNIFMEKVNQKAVEFPECIAAETLRNGLILLESWKVIDSCMQDNIKIIYLSENYDNDERIADVASIFAEFRK